LTFQKKTYKYYIIGADFEKEFKEIARHTKYMAKRGWEVYYTEENTNEKWVEIEYIKRY